MENTARKFQNEELYSNIKSALDVTTLNNFLITSPEKAVAAIGYWERKLQNANVEQKRIYMIQIAKLEALMEKMVDLSLDVYGVNAEAYVDATGFQPDETIKDVLIDVAAKAEEETSANDAKVVSIFDGEEEVKTPKLSDLAQACKQLLKKGNFDSAALMAGKYLLVGDYIPKKEKQKPRKFTEKEIDSWLKDLNANLMEDKRGAKKEDKVDSGSGEANAAANGLTTTQSENLQLLNLIITDSIAGHQDPGSRKKVLQRYLTRGVDLKTEEEMLTAFAKRKYDSSHGAKLPEADLAVLCSSLEKFGKIFFAHRGYTEESVKEWHKYVNTSFDEKNPTHFKFLKAKTGVTLFPIKDVTLPEKKTDPDLEKAKIIPEDKVDVSQVKNLLANIYKNGGEMSDLKLNPEITGLINKEIHVNDKVPVLKFGNESTLFPWLETLYKEIAKKIGPLKKATDEEVANESAKVQDNSEAKVETKKVAEEKKKIIGPEQYKPASLDDFTLLIETAAKNNITVDDFLKEHSSFVVNENGSIKKLMSKPVDGKATSSVILADKNDLKTWVTEVYKRFAKSDNPINTTEEASNEVLASSFKELIQTGKELLSKGTSYDKFMSWLNKNLLNRKMKEQKEGNEFKSPEMVKAFAKGTFQLEENKSNVMKEAPKVEDKKVETTESKVGEPENKVNESTPYTTEEIASIIMEESKGVGMPFMSLTKMMRDLYVTNGIKNGDHEYSLKEIIPIVEDTIKESNPEMYVDRMQKRAEREAKEKDQPKLPLEESTEEVTKVENKIENAEHPIFEKVDLKAQDAELYDRIISKITTMDALFNMAIEYHEAGKYNEGLSLCLEKMPVIEESKDWTPEQITSWYNTNILKKGPVETAEVVSEEFKAVDVPDTTEFKNLMGSKNPKFFKRSIGEILKKHKDSNDVRDQIISAIKTGNGSHTRQVAKMPVGEMHKQINNIKDKVEAADKNSDKEE